MTKIFRHSDIRHWSLIRVIRSIRIIRNFKWLLGT